MEAKDVLYNLKQIIKNNREILPHKIVDFQEQIENQLLILELSEALNVKIPEYVGAIDGYADLYSNRSLIQFYEGSGRDISWPDDGIQPESGWYLRLSFSTGAYILNQNYPVKTFDEFFEKLKSYGADHCDTANHSLYFNIYTNQAAARLVYIEYQDIYNQYYEKARQEVLSKRIEEAEAELAKIKEGK